MKAAMVFHYAPLNYLQRIVDSGFLLPSNAGGEVDETPLLWFSKNQVWEPTATKMVKTSSGLKQLSFKEQREIFGCIRFGLSRNDDRLINWRHACKVACISRKERQALEATGRSQGAKSSDWLATVEPISLEELHFQILLNKWMDADFSEIDMTGAAGKAGVA